MAIMTEVNMFVPRRRGNENILRVNRDRNGALFRGCVFSFLTAELPYRLGPELDHTRRGQGREQDIKNVSSYACPIA